MGATNDAEAVLWAGAHHLPAPVTLGSQLSSRRALTGTRLCSEHRAEGLPTDAWVKLCGGHRAGHSLTPQHTLSLYSVTLTSTSPGAVLNTLHVSRCVALPTPQTDAITMPILQTRNQDPARSRSC